MRRQSQPQLILPPGFIFVSARTLRSRIDLQDSYPTAELTIDRFTLQNNASIAIPRDIFCGDQPCMPTYAETKQSSLVQSEMIDGISMASSRHECSNGLSGELVRDIAAKYFRLSERSVASRVSTLGGTSGKGKHETGRAVRNGIDPRT